MSKPTQKNIRSSADLFEDLVNSLKNFFLQETNEMTRQNYELKERLLDLAGELHQMVQEHELLQNNYNKCSEDLRIVQTQLGEQNRNKATTPKINGPSHDLVKTDIMKFISSNLQSLADFIFETTLDKDSSVHFTSQDRQYEEPIILGFLSEEILENGLSSLRKKELVSSSKESEKSDFQEEINRNVSKKNNALHRKRYITR